jgi:hypothetical protein
MNPLAVETPEPEAALPVELENQITELTQEEKEGEEDFALARTNIKNLLDKGEDALEQLCRIAAATEQPRAFEIVSTLVKTLVDSNKQLMDLHEKRRQLLPIVPVKKEDEEKKANITNNNVFVGTTEEFLTLMREKRASVKALEVIEGEVIEVKNG